MNLVAAFDGVDLHGCDRPADAAAGRLRRAGRAAGRCEGPAQKRAHSALFRPDTRRARARRSAAESGDRARSAGGCMTKKKPPRRPYNNSRRGGFGAPEGTRTHTLKAREPKSRMSTNSITGANRKRRYWPPLISLYFDTGRFPRRSKTLYPRTVTNGTIILPQPRRLDKWANANAAQNFLVHAN